MLVCSACTRLVLVSFCSPMTYFILVIRYSSLISSYVILKLKREQKSQVSYVHSMNTLVMMTVPKCGLSSMVSFDGNHWEIGCNGFGSVNKASSNNGKNDHYNHLHLNGVYHHQSHEDCLSKIRKKKNSIESKLSSALQEKHR